MRVAFPEPRQALLTASWGRLGGGSDKTCPNRVVTATASGPQPSLTFPWQVACSATGAAQLRVTSAKGSSSPFKQASVDVPVNPATAPACEQISAAACAGATAAALGGAPLPAAATALPLAPPPPTGGSSAGGGCRPSPLGYQCMTDLDTDTGVKLHFSQGTAAPPVNVCTQDAPANGPASTTNAPAEQMMHFAAEAPTDGYVALAFPQEAGLMTPSDAVIGWVEDSGSGAANAGLYSLNSGYRVSRAQNGVPTDQAWATRVNSARNPAAGTTVTCFSRPAKTSLAKNSGSLDPSAARINWAVSRRPGLVPHARAGGMIMDLKRGSASGASALTSAGGVGGGSVGGLGGLFAGGSGNSLGGLSPALAAHGLLGMIAFALLMPLGMILSRHKWMFGPEKGANGNGKPRSGFLGRAWFLSHAAVQTLALATATAAFLVALLGVGWDSTPPSKAYEAHRAIGIIAFILALLQGLAGAIFRPRNLTAEAAAKAAAEEAAATGSGGANGNNNTKAGHNGGLVYDEDPAHARARRRRTVWLHGHRTGAWLTLLVGWVTVFLGCGLMTTVRGAEPAWWFAPAGVLVGAFVLLGLFLEAFKRQLQLTGRYDPRTRELRRDLALLSPNGSAGGGGVGAAAARRVSGAGSVGAGAGAAAAAGAGAYAAHNGGAGGTYPSSGGGGATGFAGAAPPSSAAAVASPYQSAGGASAAPSSVGGGTVYHTAGGSASLAGGSGGGASAGGDVYPDIMLGGSGGGLPPPPAV